MNWGMGLPPYTSNREMKNRCYCSFDFHRPRLRTRLLLGLRLGRCSQLPYLHPRFQLKYNYT